MHYQCIGPSEDGSAQVCPRCSPKPWEKPEEPWKLGIQGPKFEPRHIRPMRVEPGEDGRCPCPLDERPTDEEAVKQGFKDALDWYSYSTSGELKDPALVKDQFDHLPLPRVEEDTDPEFDEISQQEDLEIPYENRWRKEFWNAAGSGQDDEVDLTSVVRARKFRSYIHIYCVMWRC